MDDYGLVLNAGSSSLKFCVFVGHAKQDWRLAARGQIDGIGTSPKLSVKDEAGAKLADETLDASVKDGKAALAVALVLELGVGLLDEAGVGQHDGAEIDCRRGAMDLLVEAILHKFWNEPDVIDVAMGEQHGIKACGIKREIAPVEFALGS
jgi:hypothetical protein